MKTGHFQVFVSVKNGRFLIANCHYSGQKVAYCGHGCRLWHCRMRSSPLPNTVFGMAKDRPKNVKRPHLYAQFAFSGCIMLYDRHLRLHTLYRHIYACRAIDFQITHSRSVKQNQDERHSAASACKMSLRVAVSCRERIKPIPFAMYQPLAGRRMPHFCKKMRDLWRKAFPFRGKSLI